MEHDFNPFNEMDVKISEKEITSTINNLKNNKDGGLQLMINKMLKIGQLFFTSPLCFLLIKFLTFRTYPTNWIKWYIKIWLSVKTRKLQEDFSY